VVYLPDRKHIKSCLIRFYKYFNDDNFITHKKDFQNVQMKKARLFVKTNEELKDELLARIQEVGMINLLQN